MLRPGLRLKRLVVVAEPVSTAFFDPAAAQPMRLPVGDLVFGGEPAASAPADFAFLSVIGGGPNACINLVL